MREKKDRKMDNLKIIVKEHTTTENDKKHTEHTHWMVVDGLQYEVGLQ
jgi:hypothetical protein